MLGIEIIKIVIISVGIYVCIAHNFRKGHFITVTL